MLGKLNPQERIRLAQSLRKQSNAPGLSVKQQQVKRQHASDLVKFNEIEARRSIPKG
jgi:hypothetical protein